MCSLLGFHDDKLSHVGDPVRAQKGSLAPQLLENDFLDLEGTEFKINSGSGLTPSGVVHANVLRQRTCLQGSKLLYFRLLMKNLDLLEETIAASEAVQLESDILVQLKMLGVLKYFQSCLSKTPSVSTCYDMFHAPSNPVGKPKTKGCLDDDVVERVFIHSTRKEERKVRRKRSMEKGSKKLDSRSKVILKYHQESLPFSGRTQTNSRRKKRIVARNEAELSRGIKVAADLERIRRKVEEIGQAVCMSSWAEAAAIDKKVLLQRIHLGRYCRDELLRSTRSLILYVAKNYRGLGVAFEDLVQAGRMGVLQGAERFDHTRGYKFSTYVQYWIRKSMSKLVSQHARGIKVPPSLRKAMNQVQKARKALSNNHGNCADLNEIAKFTGLSAAKVMSASACLKAVGSLDQKVGDSSTKYMEMSPDMSIRSSEATVVQKHMKDKLQSLLESLDPREEQVLILRYGLRCHQRKSLEDIGRLFCVSKEWVRKIERRALAKLQEDSSFHDMSHFLYME